MASNTKVWDTHTASASHAGREAQGINAGTGPIGAKAACGRESKLSQSGLGQLGVYEPAMAASPSASASASAPRKYSTLLQLRHRYSHGRVRDKEAGRVFCCASQCPGPACTLQRVHTG